MPFANCEDASHCVAGALLGPGAASGEPTGESVGALLRQRPSSRASYTSSEGYPEDRMPQAVDLSISPSTDELTLQTLADPGYPVRRKILCMQASTALSCLDLSAAMPCCARRSKGCTAVSECAEYSAAVLKTYSGHMLVI